jgi:mRNA interferase RelE/StbE
LPSHYRIFETDQFLRDLKKQKIALDGNRYRKITNYMYKQLRTNPFYGKNIKKLKDWKPETWRYRIGDLRPFYVIETEEKVVSIVAIEPRDKAY